MKIIFLYLFFFFSLFYSCGSYDYVHFFQYSEAPNCTGSTYKSLIDNVIADAKWEPAVTSIGNVVNVTGVSKVGKTEGKDMWIQFSIDIEGNEESLYAVCLDKNGDGEYTCNTSLLSNIIFGLCEGKIIDFGWGVENDTTSQLHKYDYVLFAKYGTWNACSGATNKQLIDNVIVDPKWEYIDGVDGKNYVNVTGVGRLEENAGKDMFLQFSMDEELTELSLPYLGIDENWDGEYTRSTDFISKHISSFCKNYGLSFDSDDWSDKDDKNNFKAPQQLNDSLILLEKKLSGWYYPNLAMSEEALNQLPVIIEVKPVLVDLKKIGDDGGSTFDITMENRVDINTNLGGNYEPFDSLRYLFNMIDNSTYLKYADFSLEGGYSSSVKHQLAGTFPFKWNLRDYPFDTQELKVQYMTGYDTSIVQLRYSEKLPHVNQLDFLEDGYSVDVSSIKTKIDTFNLLTTGIFEDGERKAVIHQLTINVNLSRNGSFLYFKLFFGAILSLLISLLAFFIPTKEFEARITLCIGSVFGAIGNKYFVESSMPDVQILTKADIINNIMIMLVIINIFIIVAQSSKILNLGILEKTRYGIILIISLFIISNIFVVFY